ncbi:hypothetical protein L211DRAFT_869113 [Terfezia boudieri ATCC MYA-4762]|uniref:Uncharacterized protein n=1 Tax=Terfezia boudieri ATCC MYA-4762 TaxID=1051890 RepID=A0A3N4LJ59_9PEZI|nr:hypothetical protein L211DRAFT_869113 [Terfezia boudieri ATCC MYA-4762]
MPHPRKRLVIVLKVRRQLNDMQAQQTPERRRGCESNETEHPSPAVTPHAEPSDPRSRRSRRGEGKEIEDMRKARSASRITSPFGQTPPTKALKRRSSLSAEDSVTPSDKEHGEASASKFPMPRISKDSSQVQVEAAFTIPKGTHKPTRPRSDHSSIPPAIINLAEVTPVSEEERTYWADGTPRFVDGLWRRIPVIKNSQGRRGWKRPRFGVRPELEWRKRNG